jgi:uncharacterized protein (DUF433 family)
MDACRIESNPEICHGRPVIKGTRIMVRNILSMFSAGYDTDRILAEFPTLTRDDVAAALEYAIELVDETRVFVA